MKHSNSVGVDRVDGRTLDRRAMLSSLGAGAAALAASPFAMAQDTSPLPKKREPWSPEDLGWDRESEKYILPPLPYDAKALEPHIDEQTMQLHHDKHHQGYVNGLNTALEALAEVREGKRPAEQVKAISRDLAFNGSGHFLHVVFWQSMGPGADSNAKGGGGGAPSGLVAEHIDKAFGSFKKFADHFKAASIAVEASGWGLLVLEPVARRLMVMQAEKHQNLTAWGVVPIMAIDVWEHAYYLKYQNRRKEYVDAFMNVINWNAVEQRLRMALDRE
jgi:Fe-Mn family superoxide dismutase